MAHLFSFFTKKRSIANIPIVFGKDGNASQYLKEGWRSAEENRQWSIGPSGRIALPINGLRPIEETYLVMKLSTFIVPQVHASQRISITVNGREIVEFYLSSPDFCHKVFLLPPAVLEEKILDIVLYTPDSKSPADLGISPDPDRLGICLMYLVVIRKSFLEKSTNKSVRNVFRSQNEFQKLTTEDVSNIQSRQIFEQVLAYRHSGKNNWHYPGHCLVCEQDTLFYVTKENAPVGDLNFREQLICKHCQQKNRHRLLLSTVLTSVPDIDLIPKKIYAYEQIGSFFEYLGKRFKSAVAIGSEYLGEEYAAGSIVNGIRHENALHLSFDDKSFDVLISCDVFEHVPDIDRVFAEAFRVLKEGGNLFFTVPFDARIYASVTRAQRKGKEIDFFCPPEYHGNPIDPKGSLVFYDFGWDILDRCKGVGFTNAYAVSCWDADSGFLGESGQYVFVAKKGT